MVEVEGKEKEMTKEYEPEMPIDVMVSVLLSLALVCFLVKGLADVGLIGYWWGFFIVANLAYIIHGMKNGSIKGDPANGLVVAVGPISFYFWTIIGAWRKYKPTRRSDAQQKSKT